MALFEHDMIHLLASAPSVNDVDAFIANHGVEAVDRDGRTLLHSAVVKGDLELVRHLLRRGYDVQAVDDQGFTALHMAAIHGLSEIAALLVSIGAHLEALDSWGNTPLWRAAMNVASDDGATAKVLQAAGAKLDTPNKSGVTPRDLLG